MKNQTDEGFLGYDCISFKQAKYHLIMFSAPAAQIWEIFSINRRVEDKDEGYQRALSPSRVRAIAKYIGSDNPVPLSILVSLDPGKHKIKDGRVYLKKEKDVGWVIDGQHRLAGAHESKKPISIPVIAFLGLDIEGQIRQFVTINREAKGVPSSLYFDLLKHLPTGTPSDRAKDRAADIASELKKDESSPFHGKIVSISSPKKGEISLSTFVNKVTPLVNEEKGLLAQFTITEQVKIILNYYSALANAFPKAFNVENPVFFQTTGFGAVMRVFPTAFSLALKHQQGFSIADVSKILNEVKQFDFDAWRKYGTGNAAEIQAAEDLRSELVDSWADGEGGDQKIRL